MSIFSLDVVRSLAIRWFLFLASLMFVASSLASAPVIKPVAPVDQGASAAMDTANAGPLKVTDIVNWASFLAAFDRARSQPGHLAAKLWVSFDQPTRTVYDLSLSSTRSQVREVSSFNQQILVRALNKGLSQLVPGPCPNATWPSYDTDGLPHFFDFCHPRDHSKR